MARWVAEQGRAWASDSGDGRLARRARGCLTLDFSNNFPSRQFLHQSQVCFEKIQAQQFLPFHPPYLAKNSVLNFTLKIAHFKESQLNRPAAGIFMDDAGDLRTDLRHDPQFFLKFPAHGIARLFAVFNLAPWKFPFERHRLVSRPLAGEEEAIFQDQRGYDSFHDVQECGTDC